jgi:hypothetical protein
MGRVPGRFSDWQIIWTERPIDLGDRLRLGSSASAAQLLRCQSGATGSPQMLSFEAFEYILLSRR